MLSRQEDTLQNSTAPSPDKWLFSTLSSLLVPDISGLCAASPFCHLISDLWTNHKKRRKQADGRGKHLTSNTPYHNTCASQLLWVTLPYPRLRGNTQRTASEAILLERRNKKKKTGICFLLIFLFVCVFSCFFVVVLLVLSSLSDHFSVVWCRESLSRRRVPCSAWRMPRRGWPSRQSRRPLRGSTWSDPRAGSACRPPSRPWPSTSPAWTLLMRTMRVSSPGKSVSCLFISAIFLSRLPSLSAGITLEGVTVWQGHVIFSLGRLWSCF